MTLLNIKFGGKIEPLEDGAAKAFGEVNIDGPNLTNADYDRLKEAVLGAVGMAWMAGDYTAAAVASDDAKLKAAIEGQMMFPLLADNATCKVVDIRVVGGAEPVAPTETVALAGEVEMPDGRKAKLFGSALVGGVTDLEVAKRNITSAAATQAGIGANLATDDAYRQIASTARLLCRSDGFNNANVKVMFLQVV
jgi:hypothetical protein